MSLSVSCSKFIKPKVESYDQERQDGKRLRPSYRMSKISNFGLMSPEDLTEFPTKKSRSAS